MNLLRDHRLLSVLQHSSHSSPQYPCPGRPGSPQCCFRAPLETPPPGLLPLSGLCSWLRLSWRTPTWPQSCWGWGSTGAQYLTSTEHSHVQKRTTYLSQVLSCSQTGNPRHVSNLPKVRLTLNPLLSPQWFYHYLNLAENTFPSIYFLWVHRFLTGVSQGRWRPWSTLSFHKQQQLSKKYFLQNQHHHWTKDQRLSGPQSLQVRDFLLCLEKPEGSMRVLPPCKENLTYYIITLTIISRLIPFSY